MSEDDARDWIVTHFGTAARDRLEALAILVTGETEKQNLVAPSTIAKMWSRHLVDSAQLVALAEARGAAAGDWLDIGSGAGFPGLVVALLTERPVVLVEPRRKRAAFLEEAAACLGVGCRATVLCSAVERVAHPAAIISARAVAPLSTLLSLAIHCALPSTLWMLPKGRTAHEEVTTASDTWQGMFHVEQSITDPDSLIVLASGVSRR